MKMLVASMGVQTALCFLNAQFEIRRCNVLLHKVVWGVAFGVAAPVFWCVVAYMVVPNPEDWWCKSGAGRFGSVATWASVFSAVGVVGMVLWLGGGEFK
jgi:hypothetical protein